MRMARSSSFKWRMKETRITASRIQSAVIKHRFLPLRIAVFALCSCLNSTSANWIQNAMICGRNHDNQFSGRTMNGTSTRWWVEIPWIMSWRTWANRLNIHCVHQPLHQGFSCLNTWWRRLWSMPHHACDLSQEWRIPEIIWIQMSTKEEKGHVWHPVKQDPSEGKWGFHAQHQVLSYQGGLVWSWYAWWYSRNNTQTSGWRLLHKSPVERLQTRLLPANTWQTKPLHSSNH